MVNAIVSIVLPGCLSAILYNALAGGFVPDSYSRFFRFALAAARRAIGTLYGEQLT